MAEAPTLEPELESLLRDYHERLAALRLEDPSGQAPAVKPPPAPPHDPYGAKDGGAPPSTPPPAAPAEPASPPAQAPARIPAEPPAPTIVALPREEPLPTPFTEAPGPTLGRERDPSAKPYPEAPSDEGRGAAPPQEGPAGASAQPAAAAALRRNSAAWAVLLAAAAAGLLILWNALARRPVAGPRTSPLPFAQTAGIALRGNDLLAVDPARGLLFVFSAEGFQVRGVEQFPNLAATGIAAAETALWSSNGPAGFIHQHGSDWKHEIMRTYANAESSPETLHWDGRELWVFQALTQTVVRFQVGESLVPVKQYTLPGVKPAGLHVADAVLWTFDMNSRLLRRFKLGVLASPLDAADLGQALPPQSVVTGMAVGPSHLWLAAKNPSQILRFNLDSLRWKEHRFEP